MVGSDPEFSAFVEKKCQNKDWRPHSNITITLHIVVTPEPS